MITKIFEGNKGYCPTCKTGGCWNDAKVLAATFPFAI